MSEDIDLFFDLEPELDPRLRWKAALEEFLRNHASVDAKEDPLPDCLPFLHQTDRLAIKDLVDAYRAVASRIGPELALSLSAQPIGPFKSNIGKEWDNTNSSGLRRFSSTPSEQMLTEIDHDKVILLRNVQPEELALFAPLEKWHYTGQRVGEMALHTDWDPENGEALMLYAPPELPDVNMLTVVSTWNAGLDAMEANVKCLGRINERSLGRFAVVGGKGFAGEQALLEPVIQHRGPLNQETVLTLGYACHTFQQMTSFETFQRAVLGTLLADELTSQVYLHKWRARDLLLISHSALHGRFKSSDEASRPNELKRAYYSSK